jgi:hypothetical protein
MSRKCLNEEILTSYLEDSLQTTLRAATEEHLLNCDGCRSKLVYYMRVLDEDVREEEEPVLAAAMGAWDPAKIPVPAGRPVSGRAGMGLFLIAASVVVGVLIGVFAGLEDPPVLGDEMSLEAALRAGRDFRPRTSLQESVEDWVEFTGTRDADRSSGADSSGQELPLGTGDLEGVGSHFLGLYFLIAEPEYSRAIEYLTRALAESGENTGVLNDLGVAYVLRPKSSVEVRVEDQNVARAYFQASMELEPNYLPARFNVVLLNQDVGLTQEARAQADRYLDLDADSGWAREIRELVGQADDRGDD